MTLTLPTRDEEESERLDQSDPSWYLLTGKQRRFAHSQRRQLQRLRRVAEARGVELELPERGKWHHFIDLLRNLDRPRSAAHNVILGLMTGDEDSALQNLRQGWTFEESAHFEDMLEAMGVEAGIVRKIAGFGGDVVLDPLNLIPGAMIAKVAKVSGVTKAHGVAMRALGQNPVWRETIGRWSGIKELDDTFVKAVDMKGFAKHVELMEPARSITLGVNGLAKKIKGDREAIRQTVGKLAEETDLSRVRELVGDIQAGWVGPDDLPDVIDASGSFRNPSAVREVLDLPTPELQDEMIRLGDEFQTWNDAIHRNLEARGMKVPKLGDSLNGVLDAIDRKMTATIIKQRRRLSAQRNTAVRAAQRGAEMVRDIERGMTPQTENALQAMGFKSTVDEAVDTVQEGLGRLRPEPFHTPEEALAALAWISTEMDPDLLMRIKDVIIRDFAKSSNAIRFYDEVVLRGLVGSIKHGATGRHLTEMADDMTQVATALEELPRWVHHVATPEAEGLLLEAFRNKPSFREAFANPRTQDHLHRAFVKKMGLNRHYGREAAVPLSFDEIEASIRKVGLPSKFTKKGRQLRGRKVTEALRKKQTPLDKIRKKAPKYARFFDTDPETIIASATDQTAKSVEAVTYLNEVARIWGKTVEDVGPKRFEEMFALREAAGRGLGNIEHVVPGVAYRNGSEIRFPKEVFEEVARRYELMIKPSKTIRFFDAMQNYWKSYTLFLFPWYFTRNAIGDHLNMMSGGFMNRPTDLMHSIKASQLQWMIMQHNSNAARRIGVHFAAENRNINGSEVIDLALRNGVVGTGWMGGHINEGIEAMVEPMKLGVRSFLPLGNQFVPLRIGKWAGEFTENQRRLTFFIHKLERGENVRTAAANVKKYLGDYRTEIMTPLERAVGQRAFPFMRYSRFNIPLQIGNLVHSGARMKMLAMLRAQEAFGPEEIDATDLPEYVPEWIRTASGVPIRRNSETGELDFWLLQNWMPAAELDHVLSLQAFGQFAINQLTPFVKAPIEATTGVSLFKGQKIPREMEFLGREMDGRMVNFLRNLRLINELDKYDPLGMFRVLRRSPDQSVAKRLLMSTALGAGPQTINPAREQLQFDVERREIAARRLARARRLIEEEEFPE